MRALAKLLDWLRRDRLARAVAIALVVASALEGISELVFEDWMLETLGHDGESLLDAAVLAFIAGGLVFLLLRGAQRSSEAAAAALRVNEERFRQLTTLSADWFWESDAEHRIGWLSGGPAVAALFGDALAFGQRLWEISGIEVEPAALARHLERLAARVPFFELELARGDGALARQIHLVSGQPRFDAEGRFLGYRGVGRDVTEKRLAERALGLAKERLERAVNASVVALWEADLVSREVILNEGWPQLLGDPEVPTRTTLEELMQRAHADDLPAIARAFTESVKGMREEYSVEHRVRTSSGGWKYILSRGKVTARDPVSGRALRMSGTNLDITERRRAEQETRDAEARYRSLIEVSPDGVLLHSGGVIEYANAAAASIVRAGSPRRLAGMRLVELVHPAEVERLRERLRYLEAGPGITPFEERRLKCLDGSEVVVETAGVSYLERGRLVILSVVRDMSEQRAALERLAERERRFHDVVEAAGEYVWETDADWRYTYLSERAETVLGYLRSELLGRRPRDFMPLGEARLVEQWFEEKAVAGRAFRDLEHRSITKSGRVIWQRVSGVPVFDAAGQVAGFRGTGADVTGRKQAEERIRFLATRDALTGLPNRDLLADRVNQAILAAARSRSQLALLCFDLDGFKLVNDSLGHRAGDTLLRAVAERLSGTLRKDDTLARLGGDEFVLLWNGMRSTQDAAVVAQRILNVLARPFQVEEQTLGVTASIGVSVYPDDGHDVGELLKNSVAAMHDAKDKGRNSFRFFSPELNERALARLAMENDLRSALARGELTMHYQPVVRAAAGAARRIVGAEVLVRWQHPRHGLLLPDTFVPVAEDCGLIGALGEWTLERALSQIGAWQRAFAPDLWFALNVSARELARGDAYVTLLANALRANEVAGERIELEVTERVLMSNLAVNVETLGKLGELGVRVAIDDFGTGYSSLAYLRRLPIDKLKIDRSFLREIEANREDATIVRAIATMAKALGLHVAAEGVETEAQLAQLLSLGCDEWQGHHFSEPLEPAAFEALLTRRAAAAG